VHPSSNTHSYYGAAKVSITTCVYTVYSLISFMLLNKWFICGCVFLQCEIQFCEDVLE